MGIRRQAVICLSLSLNCSANFSDDGGMYLAKAPSVFSEGSTPDFLPPRHNPVVPRAIR